MQPINKDKKKKARDLRRCKKCNSTQTYLVRDSIDPNTKFRRCRACGYDDTENPIKIED